MKFLVFLLTLYLSIVECLARKGWNTASYKDEDDFSMGWSCYLKRLSLISFMLIGVIMYYVPNSRFYFCSACHEIIDFIADGLKTALNINGPGYVIDDSSSIFSEQESVRTFDKQDSCISTEIYPRDRFMNVYIGRQSNEIVLNSDNTDNSDSKKRNITLQLPLETIQIYPDSLIDVENFSKTQYYRPNEKNSDASVTICRTNRENRRNILWTGDEDDLSGVESEPTQYPDGESTCERTSEVERLNSYLYIKEEIERTLETQKKLEKRLLEFDKTLRNVCSSLVQKKSTINMRKEEYAVQLIETILRSVRSSFENNVESKNKKGNKNYFYDSKNINRMSNNGTTKKLISSEHHEFSKWNTVETKYRRCPMSSSLKKNIPRDYQKDIDKSVFKNCNGNFVLVPEVTTQVPIITDRAKPMLERAVRWFYRRCPNMEADKPVVGSKVINEYK